MQKIVTEATWDIKGNKKEETTDSTQNESILIAKGILTLSSKRFQCENYSDRNLY